MGTASTGTFNVTVTAVNDSPTVASNTGLTADEGSTGTGARASSTHEGGELRLADIDRLSGLDASGFARLGDRLLSGEFGRTTVTLNGDKGPEGDFDD